MATKQATSPRDRRLSSSSPLHHSSAAHLAGPNLKTTLSGGVPTTPPAKKLLPNYIKPKTSPSSEASPRKTSTASLTSTASITSSTGKTPTARRLAEKAQLPSKTTASQRALNPSSPTPKASISFRINGDKGTQSVIKSERTVPISKAKSTTSGNVKKKESCIITADHSQVKLLSDHEAAIAIERPVQELLQSDCEKVIEVINETNNEDDIKSIGSPTEEENPMEIPNGEEPEHKEVEEPGVFAEIAKQPVVFEEPPPATLERRAGVQTLVVDGRRVEPEVKKTRLAAAVASIVAETLAAKKKDTPRSNDMIEETKSKLMGSRRNKVLALVGAFETVISLQETEGQPTPKAPQVQHFLQIQQDEQSLENHKDQLCVGNQEKQGLQEVHQLEESDKNHEAQQCQMNGKYQMNGEEEENAVGKEEPANELLESGEKGGWRC